MVAKLIRGRWMRGAGIENQMRRKVGECLLACLGQGGKGEEFIQLEPQRQG
jgi:hypothetical protein